jgi:hypothetical protein
MRPIRVFVWTTVFIIAAVGIGLGDFPRLEVIYPPASRFECSSDKIPVLGRVQCDACTLLVGNRSTVIAPDGSFKSEVGLKPGENKIDVYLRDAEGNKYLQKLLITRNIPTPGAGELKSSSAVSVVPETSPAIFASPKPMLNTAPEFHKAKKPIEKAKISHSPVSQPASAPKSVSNTATELRKSKKPIEKAEISHAPVSQPAAVPKPVSNTATELRKPKKPIEKAEISHAPVSQPAPAREPKLNLAVKFYLDGKPATTAVDYILRKGHIFVPSVSPFWQEAGAEVSKDGNAVVFQRESPAGQAIVGAPAPLSEGGRLYLPLRSIFEQSGGNVTWGGTGRVYIARKYRPCTIDVAGGRNGGKLTGVIYRNVLFVRAASLAELGIKAEEKTGGVWLAYQGDKWVTIEPARGQSGGIIFELAESGTSLPRRVAVPAADVADSEYIVPLRKVLAEFGFSVEWNGDRKTASVSPEVVAARL